VSCSGDAVARWRQGDGRNREDETRAECSVRCKVPGKGERKKVKEKSDGELLDLIFMLLVFNFDLSPFTFFPRH